MVMNVLFAGLIRKIACSTPVAINVSATHVERLKSKPVEFVPCADRRSRMW